MSKNIIMSERTSSRYEELYPKTVASQISDVYSKSETSNLFLPKSGGSMGGVLDMNGNKITNLAYPTESLDSANKKYVDESLVFKKIKIADNLNLSFSGGTGLQINYPSGFTISDVSNVKFVLYEFFNLSVASQNPFHLGSSTEYGLRILSTTSNLPNNASFSIPITEKYFSSEGYVNLKTVSANTHAEIMTAQSTNAIAYFYCYRQVTGNVSIYFIM